MDFQLKLCCYSHRLRTPTQKKVEFLEISIIYSYFAFCVQIGVDNREMTSINFKGLYVEGAEFNFTHTFLVTFFQHNRKYCYIFFLFRIFKTTIFVNVIVSTFVFDTVKGNFPMKIQICRNMTTTLVI